MTKKNKLLKTFLCEVDEAINLRKDARLEKLTELIDRWEKILANLHYNFENYTEAFRNLHHLKLTIQWIEKTATREKQADENLTIFFQHLNEYVEIEIKCMQLKRLSQASNLPETKLYHQATSLTWTESKRSLIELIYALSQTTCINNGKVTLKELIDFFGSMLNTSLPNFHSTIKRMTNRNLNEQQSRSFFWMS